MPEHKLTGINIEEIPNLPASVASVETAIPAFIGYTEKAQLYVAGDLTNTPLRITSLAEYENYFGFADAEKGIEITFEYVGNDLAVIGTLHEKKRSHYLIYYSLQLFFLNGGGPCYIVSVGNYTSLGIIKVTDLKKGLRMVKKIDEVTLLLFPDAINLKRYKNYYSLYKKAMEQCVALEDRFTILNVFHTSDNISNWYKDAGLLRSCLNVDTGYLKY